MSKILGISSGFHDAAVTLIDGEDILFASHSERYSKEKNDPFLNKEDLPALAGPIIAILNFLGR